MPQTTDDELKAIAAQIAEREAQKTAALEQRDRDYRTSLGLHPDDPLPAEVGNAAGHHGRTGPAPWTRL